MKKFLFYFKQIVIFTPYIVFVSSFGDDLVWFVFDFLEWIDNDIYPAFAFI